MNTLATVLLVVSAVLAVLGLILSNFKAADAKAFVTSNNTTLTILVGLASAITAVLNTFIGIARMG